MLAVIVPAHNEAGCIDSCLCSVLFAALHPDLHGEPVKIFLVLDSCTDSTHAIARTMNVDVCEIEARNVGVARATGANAALSFGARWLAFTDADTTVAADWLVQQLRCGTDAVCGTVGVRDWVGHSAKVAEDYAKHYRDIDGHRHVHGANLGLSSRAYVRVGGFLPLEYDEDVAIVDALIAADMTIAWSAAPRVITSTRLDARAPKGFGAQLRRLGVELSKLS